MVQFADDPEIRHRIAFLPNYDIAMAQPLYPAATCWFNNPLRPYEDLRHIGHEGGVERRAQPVHSRRLGGTGGTTVTTAGAIPSADGVEDADRRRLRPPRCNDLIENEVAPRSTTSTITASPAAGWRWSGTLSSRSGPRCSRPRQVRDYVKDSSTRRGLQTPVPSTDFGGARELSAWKQRVQGAWEHVRVEHVESSGVGDAARGRHGDAHARVRGAGDLHARGRWTSGSRSAMPPAGPIRRHVTVASMDPRSPEGRAPPVRRRDHLDRSGPSGYTVRVVPRHRAGLGGRVGPGRSAELIQVVRVASRRPARRRRGARSLQSLSPVSSPCSVRVDDREQHAAT